MLLIDRLNDSDVPSALRLSTQAGWNQIDADWRRLLTLWPSTCLAGRAGGVLLATATLATYRGARRTSSVGWVGMVLVDQAQRGRGCGTAMLDAIVAAGRSATALGLDATDAGRRLYAKYGFRDVIEIGRWVCQPVTISGNTVAPTGEVDWDALTRLDSDAVGFDRGPLLRTLGAEQGVCVRVWRPSPDAPIQGYAIRRPGRVADQIGPVVAPSEQVAGELIDGLLVRDKPVYMDVPRGPLGDYLQSRGWSATRRLTRMQLAPSEMIAVPSPLVGPQVYVAAGFELG